MSFKTKAELDERTRFLAGANKGEIELDEPKEPWRIADWSPQDLKKLTVRELEDQWIDIEHQRESINDQANMMIWFICLRIREEYPSDKLMGGYMIDLIQRNPTHPLAVCSQQTRNKWSHAARWCAEMNITSLPDVGLSQHAVFILSSPANKDIAKKLFQEFKGKNSPGSAIERRIAQLKAVVTVEQPEPEKMTYDKPAERYTVPVKDGIAIESETVTVEPVPQESVIVAQPALVFQETAEAVNSVMRHIVMDDEQELVELNNVNRRMDMIMELSGENAGYLTREQQKEELKALVKSYQLSFMAEAGLLQECAKEVAAKGYGK